MEGAWFILGRKHPNDQPIYNHYLLAVLSLARDPEVSNEQRTKAQPPQPIQSSCQRYALSIGKTVPLNAKNVSFMTPNFFNTHALSSSPIFSPHK